MASTFARISYTNTYIQAQGSEQLAVGSRQSAVGSWQLAVGGRQAAGGGQALHNQSLQCFLLFPVIVFIQRVAVIGS